MRHMRSKYLTICDLEDIITNETSDTLTNETLETLKSCMHYLLQDDDLFETRNGKRFVKVRTIRKPRKLNHLGKEIVKYV